MYKDILAKQERDNKIMNQETEIKNVVESSESSESKNGILNKLIPKKGIFGIGGESKKTKPVTILNSEDEELRKEFFGFTYKHKDFKN